MKRRPFILTVRHVALAAVLTLAPSGLVGCEEANEEKVLDIEAPGIDIEVNKTEGEDGIDSVDIDASSPE